MKYSFLPILRIVSFLLIVVYVIFIMLFYSIRGSNYDSIIEIIVKSLSISFGILLILSILNCILDNQISKDNKAQLLLMLILLPPIGFLYYLFLFDIIRQKVNMFSILLIVTLILISVISLIIEARIIGILLQFKEFPQPLKLSYMMVLILSVLFPIVFYKRFKIPLIWYGLFLVIPILGIKIFYSLLLNTLITKPLAMVLV